MVTQAKRGMGLVEGNTLVEKAKGKTFGATIHQFTKAGLLSSGLERRFINLLSERNWLVHKSRSQSRNAVYHDLDMQKLLKRLDVIAGESNELLKDLGMLTESYVKEHGVSDRYIEDKANQLLEQWHASDVI